jgi:hypothetical protein
MSHAQDEQNVSRRSFLKAAAVTAAAATATGAGAALIQGGNPPEAPVILSSITRPENVVTTAGDVTAEMFSKLAAVQAENMRLQASLDAFQRRLKAEQSDNTSDALRVELDAATAQLGLLTGLIALYEQMEEVDFSEILDEGLSALSSNITSLVAELPTLAEGIAAGRQALDELEEHIPLLEDGRHWLTERVSTLQRSFGVIERLLEAAADTAAPFLQMLNEWFQDVLKWLPFGLGQRAGEIMQAISDFLGETPRTLTGLDSRIVQPMDVWLDGGNGEVPLRRDVVKPLRLQVLDKASETSVQAQQVQIAFQTRLVEPARNVANSHRAIRELIDEYRKRHQI